MDQPAEQQQAPQIVDATILAERPTRAALEVSPDGMAC